MPKIRNECYMCHPDHRGTARRLKDQGWVPVKPYRSPSGFVVAGPGVELWASEKGGFAALCPACAQSFQPVREYIAEMLFRRIVHSGPNLPED